MSFRSRRSATLIALALLVPIGGGCGGSDDKDSARTPTPSPMPAPTNADPPPTPGDLPPAFVKCMADQGFDVTSSDDIHSAPPDVLQLCFGSLHGGGG